VEQYPTMTIETSGDAVSMSTFGRICKNHFGTRLLETNDFRLNKDYYNEWLCGDHEYNGNYDVGVEIGIGFKVDGNKLIMRPFVNGWMRSAGAYKRSIEYYLEVTSITFHPKPENNYSVVLLQ